MITYVLGDLFTSPASVLVNTVNTVGVMGKGIARDFKAYFPEMFTEYQRLCEAGELTIGSLYLYRTLHKSVLNFPTKRHWRQKSRLEDIEAGLQTFVTTYAKYGITDIAFPQLGCGNGELDWESQVKPLMERHLAPLPITVYVYIYDARVVPEHRNVVAMRKWLNGQPESLSWLHVLDDMRRKADATTGHDGWFVTIDDQQFPDIVFHRDETTLILPYEAGLDLWQQLRSWGFLRLVDVPGIYRPASKALFAAFSGLPYIGVVKMAVGTNGTRDALGAEEDALQLIPGPERDREAVGNVYTPLALLPA
jgi:O-acetyl-ADP-ribose deacetylase (regulator of RNase III)